MGKKNKNAISPTRDKDYPMWYQEVVKESQMAEKSPVRGCMVIKPWGYALWENIMSSLDVMFKKTDVKNAYFPLFIPLSYLEKEAEHVEGFAKECAVVTHHRLEKGENNGLVPAGKLAEPFVVRPTSETIIGESMSRWISSYRDLPLLLNQWANVVRWEMRTRIFLRTSEFLWQEGHTAHFSEQEAKDRTKMMLDIYADFVENYLAIPVIKGAKSSMERFPGAVDTICIEAMMQDKKALQVGTSHFLGQNFARSSNIKFQTADKKEELAWTTSWGVSTRMIGGMIMVHGDDDGVIMPPKIAPAHVVLLPIIKQHDEKRKIMEYTHNIADMLQNRTYHGKKIIVEIDARDIGGARGWEWIKKGIPVRVEIGLRDIADDSVFAARRDKSPGDKYSIKKQDFINGIENLLDDIQKNLFNKAFAFKKNNTFTIDDKNYFYDFFKLKRNGINKGFAMAFWCGSDKCETKIKEDLSVTIRCLPFENNKEKGKCIYCNNSNSQRVVFAKAY
ncbi:MAG: proline--tRNA ligase [Desulfobacteraceae bacterium 4572_130]|nr:MAG: proline--tRNA ligase [Desulfobacteraceae bacterium 4572_130]